MDEDREFNTASFSVSITPFNFSLILFYFIGFFFYCKKQFSDLHLFFLAHFKQI